MSDSDEVPRGNMAGEDGTDTTALFHIRRPRRTVIVEPVVLTVGLCGLPLGLLSQFYIVAYYTEQLSNGTSTNSSSHHTSKSLCDVNTSDPAYVFGEEVQRRASYFSLVLGLCSLIPALFVTTFIGAYSDQVGRRYAIIPPIVGSTVRAFSYVIVVAFGLPAEYVLVGAVFEGCGGNYQTMLMGCFAYISDIVPAERRSLRITILETCVFITAMFTPFVAGYWVKHGGFLAPFLTIAGLYVIALVYAIFFVPETVTRSSQAKFFSTKHIVNTAQVLTRDDATKRRWKLCVVLTAFFLCSVVKEGDVIDPFFQMNRPLCWTSDVVGIFQSADVAVISVGAVIFMRLMQCCMRDGGIALTCGLLGVVHNVYTAFVHNSAMMYITPLMSIFDFLFIPTARALMSSLVHDHEQGALYGGIAFVEVICSLVGNVVFNSVYSATVFIMTGFVYLVMAAFYAVGCLLLVVLLVKTRREYRTYMKLDDVDTEDSHVS